LKLAIFDYGSGNLHSAQRSFAATGAEVEVSSDPDRVVQAAGLVVPGVGAFGSCIDQLRRAGGSEIISKFIESGRPVFGICVGMQVMFAGGQEKGHHSGLGYLAGEVVKLSAPILPHMGWNQLSSVSTPAPEVLDGIADQDFYFVHSYGAFDTSGLDSYALAHYGESEFLALAQRGLLTVTQFHPEKSGAAGLKLIKNWVDQISQNEWIAK
jgi:glutamine amidotransferase